MNTDDIKVNIENDLTKIDTWLKLNLLCLNKNDTRYVVFDSIAELIVGIKVNGQVLVSQDETKQVGLLMLGKSD